MVDVMSVIGSDEPVDDATALEVMTLLGPIVHRAPDDGDAVDAAARTVGRMQPDGLLTAVLDWWLLVATGRAPVGVAYHLPDKVPPSARGPMEELVELTTQGHLPSTVCRWVEAHRNLTQGLESLDDVLQLDYYGKSKLPGEREVWDQLREELAPIAEALRTGQPCEPYELDPRTYEKWLKRSGIDENSRRWKEMEKRAELCTATVNELVAANAIVQPWMGHPLPPVLAERSTELVELLGPLHDLVLWPLIEPSGFADFRPQGERADPADREAARVLEHLVATSGARDRAWLAAVADEWMERSGMAVPALDPLIRRRRDLDGRVEQLIAASVDATEVELLLLEHDLDGAEAALGAIDAQRRAERKSDALRQNVEQLRRRVDGSDADLAAELDAASQLLAEGKVPEAEQRVRQVERRWRAEQRDQSLAVLRDVYDELDSLEAPLSVLGELEEHLQELQAQPDRSVDPSRLARMQERCSSLREQRRSELAERIDEAHDLLEHERDGIRGDALPELELQLSEAETAREEGRLMAALQIASDLLGAIESQRVHVWTAEEGEGSLIAHIQRFCTQQIHFEDADLRRLYVAAKTKPFVILAGLTGSGKSTVARLFAGALGADGRNGRFRRVAVRPDWIDQSEVLGSINPMSEVFEPGWLAEVARQCERNLDQLHVVLLDEMNLAPVEQYLAEYLSALEEARSGAETTLLPLYPAGSNPKNRDDWPPALPFPRNLIVIGTVNVDETTRVLSERVLDRANVLQLSVEVSNAHHQPRTRAIQPWSVPFREWAAICTGTPDDGHHEFLVDIGEVLHGIGIGVGQRAHIELERFVANARGILDPELSLDLGVLQRIIPKVRGFKRDLSAGLAELHAELDSAGCARSARVVARWLDPSVADDEYLDGTDARVGLVR